MSNIKLNDILKDILTESTEEKTYIVTYYVIDKNGDDIDYDETVKATSEEEAIKKVKDNAGRLARKFDAKLKK
jgi:hypothetical protein